MSRSPIGCGAAGWLAALGVMDFAGGIVVHVTAGVSALVIAWSIGSRRGFPHEITPPHAPWMVMVGASTAVGRLVRVQCRQRACRPAAMPAMAMLATHLSAATASLVWLTLEWTRFGKPSMVGLVTGTIAGLATVTPASGFVGPEGGIVLGLVGGLVCYGGVNLIKRTLGIDDALDVLAVHGFGGATGTVLLAVLATSALGGVNLGRSLFEQLGVQALGVVAAAAWSAAATWALVAVCRAVVGLRVDPDEELEGLDQTAHGEAAYRP